MEIEHEPTVTWVPGEVTSLLQLRALVAQLEYAGISDTTEITISPVVHGDKRFVRGAILIGD